MAEIINLNRVRKGRAKAADQAKAVENRIAYGRTKADKRASDAERERAGRTLDGKKLDD